jgi:hypothetical protein
MFILKILVNREKKAKENHSKSQHLEVLDVIILQRYIDFLQTIHRLCIDFGI